MSGRQRFSAAAMHTISSFSLLYPVISVIPFLQTGFLKVFYFVSVDEEMFEVIKDVTSGFYSHFFLMEEVTGSWRLVTDLSPLYKFVLVIKFKMGIVSSVLVSIKGRDFMASLNLKGI